jgi:two-component system OmpR family response regulator
MNVLIIDDSEVARELMSTSLHRHGHRVVAMPSPIGVTRTIQREAIDVVVIDVNLPTINGDRLAMLFRKQNRMDRIGLVLVSGLDKNTLEKLGKDSEADAVVTKPEVNEKLAFAVMHAYNARR